jgi:hydrogenase maturation protein HypF
VIIDSRSGRAATMIGHDTAVCRDCLAEMFDPGSRRWRYAFTNCTNCGPRYTISRGLPYDRVRTSLKPFAMCPAVSVSTAGPTTGVFMPRPIAARSAGRSCSCSTAKDTGCPTTPSPLPWPCCAQGKIVAIKGLGGFHLACDARNAVAVALLRERKQRDEKPFVVMLANAASAARWSRWASANRVC